MTNRGVRTWPFFDPKSVGEFAALFLSARLGKPGLKRTLESFRQDLKKSLNHPRQNYLVRDPILFAGRPWHASADLIRGHVITTLYSYMHICLCLLYIYVGTD